MLFSEKTIKLMNEFAKIKKDIITKISVTAKNHYKDKFVEGQGEWDGAKWEDPQRKTNPKSSSSKKNSATLVQTGALSRSITSKIDGDNIVVSSNLPYSKRHNEGLKMPKRTFIGMEDKLEAKIKEIIDKDMDKLL